VLVPTPCVGTNFKEEKNEKIMIRMLLTLLLLSFAFIPWSAFGAEENITPGEGTKAAELDKVVDEDRPELSADVAFLSQYILASAVNMETGMRGYLLAGKEGFLAPYTQGKEDFQKVIASLSKTVDDNPAQVQLLGEAKATMIPSESGTKTLLRLPLPSGGPSVMRKRWTIWQMWSQRRRERSTLTSFGIR
jgi:CHASE3 domain